MAFNRTSNEEEKVRPKLIDEGMQDHTKLIHLKKD